MSYINCANGVNYNSSGGLHKYINNKGEEIVSLFVPNKPMSYMNRLMYASDPRGSSYVAGKKRYKKANPGKSYKASMPMYRNVGAPLKSVDTIAYSAKVAPTLPNTFVLSTTQNGIPLNLCIAGSGQYNRLGTRIKMKSIHVRGQIALNTAKSVSSICPQTRIRFLIVYDKQTNGTAPNWVSIITSASLTAGPPTAVATSAYVDDGINMGNRDRFVVLRDWSLLMPGTSTAFTTALEPATFQEQVNGKDITLNEFIKLKDMEACFNGETYTTADITTGGLFLITQSGTAADTDQTTSNWALQFNARLRFHDS